MRDPDEGLDPSGLIRTGVSRDRIPPAFEPLVHALIGHFEALGLPDAELHLYGSVATGQAVVGRSDVDVMAIGAPGSWCDEVSALLETAYAGLCRGVSIGAAAADHFGAGADQAYGNRVFLRHYCTQLAGPVRLRPDRDFAGDAAAARGFNGDLGRLLERWRADPPSADRVARKTLYGAAGIVSVADGTWTTDRGLAGEMWRGDEPRDADAMHALLAWSDGSVEPGAGRLSAALREGGIVAKVVRRFEDEIGFWRE